jgi:hypothetical protein
MDKLFGIIDKIDRAYDSKLRYTLIEKTGKYLHGTIVDSWVRLSGGKIRGKIVFVSDEKGSVEIDANDILDLLAETTAGQK